MDTLTRQNIIQKPNLKTTGRVPVSLLTHVEKHIIVNKGGYRTKRAIDIIISAFLLITLLSWVFPLLYILIRLGSKGPVLFIQKRIGYHNKVFNCIKFRTMYLNKESDIREARPGDERITPLGKILRKTYIDELPQLINVLAGDMSLVGPRPHMLYHDRKFSELIPEYPIRHLVKPGITGLAQVKGYHGPVSDESTIYGRTRLDIFYVTKISPGLDFKILMKTLSIILSFRFFK